MSCKTANFYPETFSGAPSASPKAGLHWITGTEIEQSDVDEVWQSATSSSEQLCEALNDIAKKLCSLSEEDLIMYNGTTTLLDDRFSRTIESLEMCADEISDWYSSTLANVRGQFINYKVINTHGCTAYDKNIYGTDPKTGEEKVVGTEKRHKCSCGCDNLAAGCPKCGGE